MGFLDQLRGRMTRVPFLVAACRTIATLGSCLGLGCSETPIGTSAIPPLTADAGEDADIQLGRRGSPFRRRSTFVVSLLAAVEFTSFPRSVAHADDVPVSVDASSPSLDLFVGVWLRKKPDGRSVSALTFTRSDDGLDGTLKEYSAEQVNQVSYRIVLAGASARLRYTENGKDYDFTSTTMLPGLIRFERKIIKRPALYAIQIALLNDGTLQIIHDIGMHDFKPPAEAFYQRFQRISAAP